MNSPENTTPGTQPPHMTKWDSLSLSLQSHVATVMERKRVVISAILSLCLLIVLIVFWMERSEKTSAQKLFQAQELVSHLRDPYMGEKEASIPPYADIVSLLTSSRLIQDRFNGELLEETIVANQKRDVLQKYQIPNPFPSIAWPWKECAVIQDQLETSDYTAAYHSIDALLQDVQKRGGEKLLNELVGYLIVMKGKCLQNLHLPSTQVQVQFSNWKKEFPESATKLALCVPEKELL